MQVYFLDFLEEASFDPVDDEEQPYYLRRRSSPKPDVIYRSEGFEVDVHSIYSFRDRLHPLRRDRRWLASYRDKENRCSGMIRLSDDEFDTLDRFMVEAIEEIESSYKKILSSF